MPEGDDKIDTAPNYDVETVFASSDRGTIEELKKQFSKMIDILLMIL